MFDNNKERRSNPTVLLSGGLGDAVISYCKIMSKRCPFDINEANFTHVEVPLNLLGAIKDFYYSQKLKVNVKGIPNWIYYHEILKHKFDYVLGSTWDGNRDKNDTGFTTWEINPFPLFHMKRYVSPIDVLVSVSAGRQGRRKFVVNDLVNIRINNPDRIITYTGIVNDATYYLGLGTDKTNLINKIDKLIELINLILHSNVVIAHSGFVAYLAAAAGKKLYCVSEGSPSKLRMHPSWHIKYINNRDIGSLKI